MKRALATLLDYDTSDEDDAKAVEAVRPHKKRYDLNFCSLKLNRDIGELFLGNFQLSHLH
jgi:hypothetical protein